MVLPFTAANYVPRGTLKYYPACQIPVEVHAAFGPRVPLGTGGAPGVPKLLSLRQPPEREREPHEKRACKPAMIRTEEIQCAVLWMRQRSGLYTAATTALTLLPLLPSQLVLLDLQLMGPPRVAFEILLYIPEFNLPLVHMIGWKVKVMLKIEIKNVCVWLWLLRDTGTYELLRGTIVNTE